MPVTASQKTVGTIRLRWGGAASARSISCSTCARSSIARSSRSPTWVMRRPPYGPRAKDERMPSGIQVAHEVVERRRRLGLLLAREVDAASGQERAGLGCDLEHLPRRAFGRQLEDPRPVRIQPQLGDRLAAELLGREVELEHEDRAEQGEVVELEPGRRMRRVEGALLLREQLAGRPLAGDGAPHVVLAEARLHRRRADVAAGHGVELDDHGRRPAQLLGDGVWRDRAQLDHRVVRAPLDASGADHDAGPVEREVRRVEEADHPDLRVERVHPERERRTPVILRGHGQFELDAVRAFGEREDLAQPVLRHRARGHAGTAAAWWRAPRSLKARKTMNMPRTSSEIANSMASVTRLRPGRERMRMPRIASMMPRPNSSPTPAKMPSASNVMSG